VLTGLEVVILLNKLSQVGVDLKLVGAAPESVQAARKFSYNILSLDLLGLSPAVDSIAADLKVHLRVVSHIKR
jgi:hypothetical protein